MPRRSRAPDNPSPDPAHPRHTMALLGQDEALARAARAVRGGRPPAGWLISGPPGVGKATMAYRIARYLLAHGATDAGAPDLSVPERDPAAIQVAAGSHPGLLLLQRGENEKTGKLMTVMGVEASSTSGSLAPPQLPWKPMTTPGPTRRSPSLRMRAVISMTSLSSPQEASGELTWIGLGPVTNLALALLLDPTLPQRLRRVRLRQLAGQTLARSRHCASQGMPR